MVDEILWLLCKKVKAKDAAERDAAEAVARYERSVGLMMEKIDGLLEGAWCEDMRMRGCLELSREE